MDIYRNELRRTARRRNSLAALVLAALCGCGKALPDLVIADLRLIPASPCAPGSAAAEITVANRGDGGADSGTVEILLNGSPAAAANVPPLGGGSDRVLSQTLAFPAAGSYAVEAVADPGGLIEESDETNNTASTTVTVADCVAADIVAALDAARARIAAADTMIDLDGDGFSEYRRVYDAGGQLIREEVDTDGGGAPDMVWDHSAGVRTFTADEDQDGVFEYSEEAYEDPSDPNVYHVTVTEDTSGDGVPDYRISYSVDSTTNLIEIQHSMDDDQDGSFDSVFASSTTREQPYGGMDVEKSGAWGCSDQEEQLINDAYDQMLAQGWACLNAISPRLALDFLVTQARSTIKIYCLDSPTPCGSVDSYSAKWRWLLGFDELPIYLGEGNFDGSNSCRPLHEVLFHELLHYVLGLHRYGNGLDDPGDRIFGCVNTCFGDVLGNPGDSQTCAACLGKKNGTSRCSNYPQKPCIADVPAYCRCNEQIYPNMATCGGSCPVGLGCFAFQCWELGPCR